MEGEIRERWRTKGMAEGGEKKYRGNIERGWMDGGMNGGMNGGMEG